MNVREPHALIFYHLPKCGGTSLRKFLEINYGDGYRKVIRTSHWLDFYDRADTLPDGNICVAGHYCWGIEELIAGRAIYYTTFLREPFRRAVSDFRYNELTHVSGGGDFLRFVRNRRNLYVNWLGGGSPERARENLEKKFFFVGLVEHFEASVAWLASRFSLKRPYFRKLKVSRSVPDVEEENFREIFYEHNREDVELYALACRLFREKTAGFQPPRSEPERGEPEEALVVNEQGAPAEVLARLPFRSLLAAIDEKRLPPGDVQALVSLYQQKGAHARALELFERYIPFVRLCFWRADLLGLTVPGRVAPYLVEVMRIYGKVPSDLPDSSLNKHRRKLLNRTLTAMKVHGGAPEKAVALLLRHLLFPLCLKACGGFQAYYNTCVATLDFFHRRIFFRGKGGDRQGP